MLVYPVTWTSGDSPQHKFEVTIFGKTRESQSVCLRVGFPCYFFVKTPPAWTPGKIKLFIAECVSDYHADAGMSCGVTRKDMWGYDPRDHQFVQLAFTTQKNARFARARLQKQYKIYEGNVDPVIRLCHVCGVTPADWLDVFGGSEPDIRVSTCDLEVCVGFRNVRKGPSGVEVKPPLVMASWDIECYSDSGGFPVSDNPHDAVIQIATTFQRLDQPEPYKRSVVVLDTCDDIPGVEVIAVATEQDVIQEWIRVLDTESVDVLLGYNVWQFDWRYIRGRMGVLVDDTGDPLVDVSGLGKLVGAGGEHRDWDLNTNAYGQNKFTTLSTPGVLQLDLLQLLRRDHKLDSYSLNNVSKHFLNNQKIDLPARELFKLHLQGPAERKTIAEYAVRDTELPLLLMHKLAVMPNLMQMALATCVPMDYLLTRGQQIKVWSLVLRKARAMGFVIPDNEGIGSDTKYEGATVLDAKAGAYFEVVSALDFASLYPSIIRAHNMCYSTLVLDKSMKPQAAPYTIDTGLGQFSFAQDTPGVIPSLLEELAVFRKQAKADMAKAKDAGDEWAAAIHNGAQLAFKVSMNSVYGFLGATKGFFPCVPIAAAVTATGRCMLQTVKDLVQELVPGSDVVYGDTDSVMCIFKVPEEHRHDLAYHHALAERVARDITARFKAPIELEFEKTFYPYLLFSKKRYCGAMYTRPDRMDKIDTKGIQMVRRGTIEIVRTMCTDTLEALMHDKSAELAMDIAKRHVRSFVSGGVPMDALVLSKALRGNYKNANQPHVAVAQKITVRRGVPVPHGERVAYVFVRNDDHPDGLQTQRAEDPAYVQEHGLPLDYLYYLDHQVLPPLVSLLSLVHPNPEHALLHHVEDIVAPMRAHHTETVKTAKRIRKNKNANQLEITHFFR